MEERRGRPDAVERRRDVAGLRVEARGLAPERRREPLHVRRCRTATRRSASSGSVPTSASGTSSFGYTPPSPYVPWQRAHVASKTGLPCAASAASIGYGHAGGGERLDPRAHVDERGVDRLRLGDRVGAQQRRRHHDARVIAAAGGRVEHRVLLRSSATTAARRPATTVVGGSVEHRACRDHASVAGSRCAISAAVRLSAGLTPTVSVCVYGAIASMRSSKRWHSACSVGSVDRGWPTASTCGRLVRGEVARPRRRGRRRACR